MTWWRMWSNYFRVTDARHLDWIATLICPCHELWGMTWQKPYSNDNAKPPVS